MLRVTVVRQLLETGFAGVALKRTTATDLLAAIQLVRQGGTYVCPALQEQLSTARPPSVGKDIAP